MYRKYCLIITKKGISSYKVAKETGIPVSTFSDWKSGRSNPKYAKLKKIADYLGIAVEELV